MQFVAAIVLLFVLIVWDQSCAAKISPHQIHNNRLKFFPCADPQPRVFELTELELNPKDKTKLLSYSDVDPNVTILHRCECTGYCKGLNERCMPNATENVPLTFRYMTGKGFQYRTIKLVNHTQCACKESYEF